MVLKSTRILVIEDESAHAEAIHRSLEAMPDTEIRFGISLRDFQAETSAWNPDIALVDLNLPDGRATEILADPADSRSFPIIVMTSFGNDKIAVEAMKAGAMDYLVKSPETFTGLPQTVKRSLREWGLHIETRRLHQELKDREETYRRQFSDNFSIMLLIDPTDGQILDANDAAVRFYGYTRDQLMAMAIIEINVLPAHEVKNAIASLMQQYGRNFEFKHRLSDGTMRDVEVTSSKIIISGRPVLHSIIHDISERKLTEEALRNSHELLSLFIAKSPVYTYIKEVTPIQSRVVNASDNFFKLIGISGSEVIGKTMDELYPVDMAARINAEDWFVATSGKVLELTEEFNGRNYTTVKYPIIQDKRNLIAGFTIDTTEHKKANDTILLKNEMLQKILDTIPQFICWKDRNSKFLGCNNNYAKMVGLSNSESIIGKTDWDLPWKQNETESFIKYDRKIMDADSPEYHIFESALDFTGKEICLDTNKVPIHDVEGNVSGILVAFEDITERKLAEKALAASEAEARTMLQTTMDGVWLMDSTGRIMEVNDAACRMLGYSRDEMCRMAVSDVEASEFPEDLRQHIERVNREGTDLFESIHRRKDGTCFPVEISIAHIADQARTVAYVRDISERKAHEVAILRMNGELEQRVKERTAQLEAANKEMEAFSYSVSHDLRAPLRSIDGFSRVLTEDYQGKLDEDGKHYLNRIRSGTQRMGHLIDDLLKLSKTSRNELTLAEFDLSRVCSRVVGDLADLSPERRVEVSIQPGMLVQADNHLMQVVLENLLGNAWKFTSKSQEPRVEAGETVSPSGERTFFIRDNGAGFDMANADKVFNAFQRLHAITDFEGSGIGLAIVQRIIHRHGGRIWAEAEPGKGATFFFTLP